MNHQELFKEQIKQILDSEDFEISTITYDEMDEDGEPAVVEIRIVRVNK